MYVGHQAPTSPEGNSSRPSCLPSKVLQPSGSTTGIRHGGLPCLRHARMISFNTNPDTYKTFVESCLHRKENTDLKGYTDFTGNEFLHGSQHDWVTNFLPFTVSFHFPIQSRGFASLCMGIVRPNSVHLELEWVHLTKPPRLTAASRRYFCCKHRKGDEMVSHIPLGVIYRASTPHFGAETAQSAPQSLNTHSRA